MAAMTALELLDLVEAGAAHVTDDGAVWAHRCTCTAHPTRNHVAKPIGHLTADDLMESALVR